MTESKKPEALLVFSTLGIVYGDIATSPLYAVRECFIGPNGFKVHETNVLGILSLILWSLLIVISFKYLVLVLRAENAGEGGILALANLALGVEGQRRRRTAKYILALGIFGAALLYGDGMITPALSVLSAVSGLTVATHWFSPFIIPLTLLILTGLFLLQSRGTQRVSSLFSPVILLWLISLASLGLYQILQNPSVLRAANPWYAVHFFLSNGWTGYFVLASVFLVVTGGEALYADLGHFGRKPIQTSWFLMVLPALVLNYFGQGALILDHPEKITNTFFQMAPDWMLYPLVLLATLATVIASQAIITGVFSLTHQAVQLDYFPPSREVHTSQEKRGRIYMPLANWFLYLGTVLLVLEFKSSSGLAAAYGIAVSVTMVITTLLLYFVMVSQWGWRKWQALALIVVLLSVDLSFVGSMVSKLPHGGWVPLAIAMVIFIVMTTWKNGTLRFGKVLQKRYLSLEDFFKMIEEDPPNRQEGTVVYLSKYSKTVPPALTYNYRVNRSLHEKILLLSVRQLSYAHVSEEHRFELESLGKGFYSLTVRYGFMDKMELPQVLARVDQEKNRLNFDVNKVIYILTHERFLPEEGPGRFPWRKHLFSFMYRNAQLATNLFHLPADQVMEIDSQIEI